MLRKILMIIALCAFVSCSRPLSQATKGGFIGTAAGAGTGALIGSQVGSAGIGAAVGGGAGLLTGAIVGAHLDAQDVELELLQEERYEHQQQLERQRREIEDLRRQQRYDDLYRRY